MRDRRAKRHLLGFALMGVLLLPGMPVGIPLSGVFSIGAAWASEDPAAFDRAYKETGKLATQLASRYEGALRQTALRLKEVARQDPEDLARAPLAIETAHAPWPIVTYLRNGDKLTQIPDGRRLLSLDDLSVIDGNRTQVFLKASKVFVAVQASGERYSAVEIPLAVFTEPLAGLSLGGDSALLLLDDQGRSLSSRALGAEEAELVKSVGTDVATTLVSKTSVLSVARIPTAKWTVVVRLPLAEAYRGISVPELDNRALPNPLYLVRRTQGGSLEGVGQGILMSLGGVAVLIGALILLRRRLKDPANLLRNPFKEVPSPFNASLAASQSEGLAVLEALLGERADSGVPTRSEGEPSHERPPRLPVSVSSDGPASNAWRETLQAEVGYLRAELSRTQDQLRQVIQSPLPASRFEHDLEELRRRISEEQDAELRAFSEALRQRMDLEARRLAALEQTARQAVDALERKLAQQDQQHQSQLESFQAKYEGLTDGLRQRFEQEDRLLASLDQEVERTRSELEGYRSEGIQADRQASERIEAMARMLKELHAHLGQAQASNGQWRDEVQGVLAQLSQENVGLREELGTLSARVHRVVQLLAKGRSA